MVLNSLLITGSLDSIKSWGVGGHGFFGWHCISSNMERAIDLNYKQLVMPSPVVIEWIASGIMSVPAGITYSVALVLVLWLGLQKYTFTLNLSFILFLMSILRKERSWYIQPN